MKTSAAKGKRPPCVDHAQDTETEPPNETAERDNRRNEDLIRL